MHFLTPVVVGYNIVNMHRCKPNYAGHVWRMYSANLMTFIPYMSSIVNEVTYRTTTAILCRCK